MHLVELWIGAVDSHDVRVAEPHLDLLLRSDMVMHHRLTHHVDVPQPGRSRRRSRRSIHTEARAAYLGGSGRISGKLVPPLHGRDGLKPATHALLAMMAAPRGRDQMGEGGAGQ